MKTTVQGLAVQLEVDRDDSYHLMKYLEAKKLAVKTGETALPEGKSKGKGQDIYEIPEQVLETLKGLRA